MTQTIAADLSTPAASGFRFRRAATILLVAGALAWAAFAYGLVPWLINSAYHDRGPAILARAMRDKANFPVSHYLGKWYALAGAALAVWILGIALPLLSFSRNFAAKYVGLATPGTLGALRMFVALICIYFALDSKLLNAPSLIAGGQPIQSMGVMDVFYRLGLKTVATHESLALAYQRATVLALALAAVGLFTRVSVPVAAVLYLSTIGVNRSLHWFNHAGVMPWYLLMAMSFMRAGDGFSLDRMIRIWRQKPVADSGTATAYYAWCRWTLWLILALAYLMAGLSKLGNTGFRWWESTNLEALIYRHTLNAARGELPPWLADSWIPHWAFGVMGVGTIVTEVGYFGLLFSRWLRLVAPVAVALMHYSIIKVMDISFWDLIWLQAIFYDWRAIRRWVAARVARRAPQWTLLYDGYCPLCRRTAGLITGMDLLERIRLQSFRETDFAAFNAEHGVGVTKHRADEEMLLLRGGRVFGGFDAYQRMSLMLPLLWPIAPLMWLPGVSHVGRAIYAWVARNRLSFFQCTDACQFEPGLLPTKPPEPAGRRHPIFAAVAGFVPAIVVAMWFARVEWYPLTSFQMFTKNDETYTSSSVIAMQHIYLIRPDGTQERAYLDRLGWRSKQYWPEITAAFKFDADREKTTAKLRALGAEWNARQPTDATRIARFELRESTWDFRDPTTTPDAGKVRRTIVVDIPSRG